MAEGFFSNITTKQVETVQKSVAPIPSVDAFRFLTSSEFLNKDPYPFQRIAIKYTYNLFETYPPDEEEWALIKLEELKWNIKIDLSSRPKANKHVWCLGRRSAKSRTCAWIATYETYSLICKGNPQEYYNILERHPIYIVHIAARGKQAEEMFAFTSNDIRSVPFFRPYIDFDKDNSTELRLFSPYDLFINERTRKRNSLVPRGMQKETIQEGTLNIKSITTAGAGARGEAIKCLIFSELAHVQRAKMIGSSMEDGVEGENPKTDYALVKAMMPSVLDFKDEGLIIFESSPVEKGGEFYRHYCIAGGSQQDLKEGEQIIPADDYKVLQFATYEARPTISQEDLADEFRADPLGASMEYGASFGNPSGQFISEKVVADMFVPNTIIIRVNPGNWHFAISIDPGGKAKKKIADTYAISWGHPEGTNPETEMYYINGLYGFDAKKIALGNGQFETIMVDPNEVIKFVVDLCEDLGGNPFISEIVYDQFESSTSVHTLQSNGYPALETFFTNQYKHAMYSTYLQKLEARRVKIYSNDEGGRLERMKLEMKYLQRSIAGNYVYYHHPSTGPVQTDDWCDSPANLIHRLSLRAFPTMQSTKDSRRKGSFIQPPTRKGPSIIKGPGFGSGGGRFRK